MCEWDEDKRAANLEKHGVDFSIAWAFEWDTALTAPRFASIGFIGPRLHVLVWTPRGERFRIISLRKANAQEVKRYADCI